MSFIYQLLHGLTSIDSSPDQTLLAADDSSWLLCFSFIRDNPQAVLSQAQVALVTWMIQHNPPPTSRSTPQTIHRNPQVLIMIL